MHLKQLNHSVLRGIKGEKKREYARKSSIIKINKNKIKNNKTTKH